MPLLERKTNAQGKRFFGLHFYPGVAEYAEPGKKPYRVFLNENTLREMDRTFEGRPVFVMHVDGVEQDIDALNGQTDGWVLRSFYNAADGKHWVEFLVVSEQAEDVIKKGWQLSNSYFPKGFAKGGLWNGVSYDKEITAGEYEHLALVPNPRYEESVIMTPDEFKQYNESLQVELESQRIANAKKERGKMAVKLNFFKRTKVENTATEDLESLTVLLPKTKREVTIAQLVNEADAMMAHPKHMVDMGDGNKMTVGDMHNKYCQMRDELAAKNTEEEESDVDTKEEGVDVEGDDKDVDNDGDDDDGGFVEAQTSTPVTSTNEGDDEEEGEKKPKAKGSRTGGVRGDKDTDDVTDEAKKNAKKAAAKQNELEAARAKADKKKKDKEKAEALRNAPDREAEREPAKVYLSEDKVARGKQRYGSN